MYSKQNNRINSRIVFTMFLRRKNITLSFYWTCNDFRLNLETQLSNSGKSTGHYTKIRGKHAILEFKEKNTP